MKELLKKSCEKMGIDLEDNQLDNFMIYKDMLKQWNEKINLTALTEDRDIILKHFADCLTVLTKRSLKGSKVIDVGTGAGFPGLCLRLAEPNIKLTLLDSLNKRIVFLENLCAKVGADDVECIHSRAEDGGRDKEHREKYDFCVSRAVADLSVLSEFCLPFVKVGGEFIALKGPDSANELKNAEKAIEILGGSVEEIAEVDVPYTELSHKLIIIKKIKPTPKAYPRKAGKAAKNPIM